MAWRDGRVSHVKNGIYGEMFVAAMLAEAAVESDLEAILRAGRSQIPTTSRLHKAITGVVDGWKKGVCRHECFLRIHQRFDEHLGHDWCHVLSNAMVVAYATERVRPTAADPLAAFYGIGTGYIDLAYDCPRLLRFITQTPDGRAHGGEFLSIFNLESIRKNAGAIAAELEIPVEAARTWMEDCIICAHGIVTLLIAGLMTAARGEAKEKLFRMGCGALIAAGADKARTRAILEPLRGGNV